VGVAIKLSGNGRFKAVDDFRKFSAENRPAILVSWWDVTQNVNLSTDNQLVP